MFSCILSADVKRLGCEDRYDSVEKSKYQFLIIIVRGAKNSLSHSQDFSTGIRAVHWHRT
jgi:hypothetical protein